MVIVLPLESESVHKKPGLEGLLRFARFVHQTAPGGTGDRPVFGLGVGGYRFFCQARLEVKTQPGRVLEAGKTKGVPKARTGAYFSRTPRLSVQPPRHL